MSKHIPPYNTVNVTFHGIYIHFSLPCMTIGCQNLNCKEITKIYEVQLKRCPLESHNVFNSKRDNLKFLTFISLLASLCDTLSTFIDGL